MSRYLTLIKEIEDYITNNGNGEITGERLQGVLVDIVNTLGENSKVIGVVTPGSKFDGYDGNAIAFAVQDGIYPNFGGLTVEVGEIALFVYNGSWSKSTLTSMVSKAEVEDIDRRVKILEKNSPLSSEFVEVYENGLFFVDVNGYVGVKIDQNGLHGINIIEI